MPINPIKEQRQIAKKYVIGYYSENPNFGNALEQALSSCNMAVSLISLNSLDEDTLKLYLSVLDEAIFDSSIPENINTILHALNSFFRIINIKDIATIVESIEARGKLILKFKHEKNFEHEKDLKFIMQIVSILENKDPYTKDHSARVAKYSLAIGEIYFAQKYDEIYNRSQSENPEQYEQMKHDYVVRQLNLTMLAAWAHDIGKNSIAQNLLNKPSKLTDSEYNLMKMHADFGAEMVRKILGDETLAEAIENHHERIDGFGYHNLTDFSDAAKIIAVADTFDAMTTTRPYTTKLDKVAEKSKLRTVSEAINELQVSSHHHFDLYENRESQQLDTRLTDIFVQELKKDLNLINGRKTNQTTLLTGGIDEKGFLKAGFWDDKTQEYAKDPSVSGHFPNLLK